jgi:2-succinyl-6-hydroxy-2,4-cyclohexadiene-1-carboxylate synthase
MMLYALHGFLGLPSDWELLAHQLLPIQINPVDLFSFSAPSKGLAYWGRSFNDWVSAKQPSQKPFLLGYSLGGRLALHALMDAPQLWGGGIIVSAHTGLKVPQERTKRLQQDIQWGQRFLNDLWETVLTDWNAQSVFQEIPPSALEGWSLGQQDDLQESLSQLPLPLLWIAGEKDPKAIEIVKQMAAQHPYSSHWIAPSAGHRVPWESQELFVKTIAAWINNPSC